MHAAIQFQHQFPECAINWYHQSNYLCFLAVENEECLKTLLAQAIEQNINVSVFQEPDIDNQITAIAIAPGSNSKKLCSQLKLA